MYMQARPLTNNIEIKAIYPDHEHARELIKELQGHLVGTDHQVDTYFVTRSGRLKLRQSSLGPSYLIPYLRDDSIQARQSRYVLLTVDQPAETVALLSHMLEVSVVVDKVREIYLIDNVRVHLDQVAGLGSFLEFEAVFAVEGGDPERETRRVRELMQRFDIDAARCVAESYSDLLLKRE